MAVTTELTALDESEMAPAVVSEPEVSLPIGAIPATPPPVARAEEVEVAPPMMSPSASEKSPSVMPEPEVALPVGASPSAPPPVTSVVEEVEVAPPVMPAVSSAEPSASLPEAAEVAPALPKRNASISEPVAAPEVEAKISEETPPEKEVPPASTQKNQSAIAAFSNKSREALLRLQEIFVTYRTFSWSFLKELGTIPRRRRRAREALHVYWNWMQQEKANALALPDGEVKSSLLQLIEMVEHQFPSLRNDARAWVGDGWRKTILLVLAVVSVAVGFGVGIPATLPVVQTYLSHAAPPPVSVPEVAVEPEVPPVTQDTAYLLLSCERSSFGRVKRIRVFSSEGKEIAEFPPQISKVKRPSLTVIPAGECGVSLETAQGQIVGSLSLAVGQKRYIDLSKWTESGATAPVKVTSNPSGKEILCDGVMMGKAPLIARVVLGIHRLRIFIPGFPPEEQTVMVSDDEGQKVALSVTVAKLVIQLPEQEPSRNIRVFVNGSIVSSPQSHVVLSGQQLVAIYDGDLLIGQQHVTVEAGEEARMKIVPMSGGGLALTGPEKETAIP